MTHAFRILFILLLCGIGGTAFAAQATPKNQTAPKKVPTTIVSGRMEYDANAQTVVFLGNVHVTRPDFELWADKMTVYLQNSGNGGDGALTQGMEGGDIDRIVAEKNVRMKSEDREGTCNKATYYSKEDKFVMEGSPRLWDNKQSTITGGTVVHYLGTNKSEVLNNAGITFYAPDKTDSPSVPTVTPQERTQ